MAPLSSVVSSSSVVCDLELTVTTRQGSWVFRSGTPAERRGDGR
jgi:hypothetical protein